MKLASHHDVDATSDAAEDEIPLSVLRPAPRHNTMPPLPDLRFEQSYLKSIEKAESWKGVAWITFRDQVLMCFAQGVLWTLVLNGWRHWNRSSKFNGRSVGARIRRWWWGVNKWTIPTEKSKLKDWRLAKNVTEVSEAFLNVWVPFRTSFLLVVHMLIVRSTTKVNSPARHATKYPQWTCNL